MKKQAIIFDIDGTAIDSPTQKLPTKRLIDAIERLQKTFYLCAATGRVWSFAKPVLQALQLQDPCIISAGTQICDPHSGDILWQCTIAPHDLIAAAEVLQTYPDFKVLWNDYTDKDYLYGGHQSKDINLEESVYFLEMVFVPEDIAQKIVAELSKIDGLACLKVVAQRPGTIDIHITNKYATKEHAMSELRSMLKISKEDTVGIGDSHNDVHLFAGVHHKIAMANSVPELKALADQTIGRVADDGLATYLESLQP